VQRILNSPYKRSSAPMEKSKLSKFRQGGCIDSPALRSYAIMLFFFLTALAVAGGQHLFYLYLDKHDIDQVGISQTWVIRIGNACAFLFKTVLVAAVGFAYAQQFWVSVRKQAIEIRSLDAMFCALFNPLSFLNIDFLRKTQLLSFLAAISWVIPLSAVFAPGALNGTPHHLHSKSAVTASDGNVRSIKAPGLGPLDSDVGFALVSAYILTDVGTLQFNAPSLPLFQIVSRVLYTGNIAGWSSPCGAHCSYVLEFNGPAYNCSQFQGPLSSLPVNLSQIAAENFDNNPALQSPGSTLGTPPDNSSLYWFADDWGVPGRRPIGIWMRCGNLLTPDTTINCKLTNATYTLNVSYTSSMPFIQTNVSHHDHIDSGFLSNSSLWSIHADDDSIRDPPLYLPQFIRSP
jgi:hypothetical protein